MFFNIYFHLLCRSNEYFDKIFLHCTHAYQDTGCIDRKPPLSPHPAVKLSSFIQWIIQNTFETAERGYVCLENTTGVFKGPVKQEFNGKHFYECCFFNHWGKKTVLYNEPVSVHWKYLREVRCNAQILLGSLKGLPNKIYMAKEM